VPAVEGGSVIEKTGPESVKAEILMRMGAMSMKMKGTVEVVEQDAEARRALLRVKAREAGGQGHANADVTFQLNDGGGTVHTSAQITGKGRLDGRGRCHRRPRRADHRLHGKGRRDLSRPVAPVANIAMRQIREGEVPFDGGTAIQEDPDRPAFRGNGPDDYVCVQCGNVLAEAMHPVQMTKKVRVRCGRCGTVNVAVTESD
jgi:ribosomal protein S27AE